MNKICVKIFKKFILFLRYILLIVVLRFREEKRYEVKNKYGKNKFLKRGFFVILWEFFLKKNICLEIVKSWNKEVIVFFNEL